MAMEICDFGFGGRTGSWRYFGYHLARQEFISTVQKATHEPCFKLRYMTLYID